MPREMSFHTPQIYFNINKRFDQGYSSLSIYLPHVKIQTASHISLQSNAKCEALPQTIMKKKNLTHLQQGSMTSKLTHMQPLGKNSTATALRGSMSTGITSLISASSSYAQRSGKSFTQLYFLQNAPTIDNSSVHISPN